MPTYIIDFDSKSEKRRLYNYQKTLSGLQRITVKAVVQNVNRYKYLFGHVLRVLEEAEIYEDEFKNPLTGDELWEEIKKQHNMKITRNSVTGRTTVSGGSVNDMPDRLYFELEEKILAYYSQEPYNLGDKFIDRDTWNAQRKHEAENMNNIVN